MNTTLIQIVDAALASATQRGGSHLACRPGCLQCCIGVFPISQQDAYRLREGLETIEQTDKEKSQRIQARAAASRARLNPHFPGDPISGILADDYEHSPLFTDEILTESGESLGDIEPCPVLDPTNGTCDLYHHRPIVCRTFGPPMRTAEDNLATCELCFTHATTEQIAACELEPTLPALEAASNEAFNAVHNLYGQTIIAYALRND
jgi:Fe-S-cluster containining protein